MDITRLFLIRCVSHSGVYLSGILVPLLIYNITNSQQMAAIAIAFEWTIKIACYAFSGSICNRWSHKNVLISVDSIRMFLFLGFVTLCFSYKHIGLYSSFFLVVILSTIMQCSTAIANVATETLTHRIAGGEGSISSFAKILKADYLAAILPLSLTLLSYDSQHLELNFSIVGASLYFITPWFINYHFKASINEQKSAISESKPHLNSSVMTMVRSLLKNNRIISLTICNFLFEFALFYLYKAGIYFKVTHPVQLVDYDGTAFKSGLSMMISISPLISIAFLQCITKLIKSYQLQTSSIILAAFSIQTLAIAILINVLSFTGFLICGLLLKFSGTLYQIVSKNRRQLLLSDMNREQATGVLISFQASFFWIIAICMFIFGRFDINLTGYSIMALSFMLICSTLLKKYHWSELDRKITTNTDDKPTQKAA